MEHELLAYILIMQQEINQTTTMTTQTTKYTPGPWEVTVADYSTRILANQGKIQIALVIDGNGITYHPSEANARLISAAPDLLNTLKHLLAKPDLLNDPFYLKQIKETIAKAEGTI